MLIYSVFSVLSFRRPWTNTNMIEEKETVEAAKAAFDGEFEKFVDPGVNGDAAARLSELVALRVRHTGKKSALAESKKLIGKVAPEVRGEFGQLVQSVERSIVERLDAAEASLKAAVSEAKTEAERIDVTLPGRRIKRGTLHPITIVRRRLGSQ